MHGNESTGDGKTKELGGVEGESYMRRPGEERIGKWKHACRDIYMHMEIHNKKKGEAGGEDVRD